MPRLTRQLPRYRRHKASGRAVVTIHGRDHYLGLFDSRESRNRYENLMRRYLDHGRSLPERHRVTATIRDLAERYRGFAKEEYVKNGEHTSEYRQICRVMRQLEEDRGDSNPEHYEPQDLHRLKMTMSSTGRARTSINRDLGRVRRFFGWAAERGYVDPSVFVGLRAVTGLKRGRSAASDPPPIKPVPMEVLQSVMEHLHPIIQAMVWVQYRTAMRPGELVTMRPCDVKQNGSVWYYRPQSHKTQHHGHERTIAIGPKAQRWLETLPSRDPRLFYFSPREVVEDKLQKRRETRTSPLSPSQRNRLRKPRPEREPGLRYTTASYNQAIKKGCAAAFDEPSHLARRLGETDTERRARLDRSALNDLEAWECIYRWSPNQLRHAAATQTRAAFGLEAAQVIMGHQRASTTEIYAEAQRQRITEIAARIG